MTFVSNEDQLVLQPGSLPPSVLVRKLKLNGVVQLDRAYELGADQHGTWLYTPAGSLHRGQDGETIGWCQSAQDSTGHGQHAVKLIHAEPRWSVCSWIATGEGVKTAADIAKPPTRDTPGWTFIDLELDPLRDLSGNVIVEDWDEFNQAVSAGQISTREAEHAREECARLVAMLQQHDSHSGVAARRVLAEAAAAEWPPFDDPTAYDW